MKAMMKEIPEELHPKDILTEELLKEAQGMGGKGRRKTEDRQKSKVVSGLLAGTWDADPVKE